MAVNSKAELIQLVGEATCPDNIDISIRAFKELECVPDDEFEATKIRYATINNFKIQSNNQDMLDLGMFS